MPNIEMPPESADGGYWYVVARIGTGTGLDEYRPDLPAHVNNWTANDVEHDGEVLFLVRTPDPVVGVEQVDVRPDVLVELLGHASKPRGRVGGR